MWGAKIRWRVKEVNNKLLSITNLIWAFCRTAFALEAVVATETVLKAKGRNLEVIIGWRGVWFGRKENDNGQMELFLPSAVMVKSVLWCLSVCPHTELTQNSVHCTSRTVTVQWLYWVHNQYRQHHWKLHCQAEGRPYSIWQMPYFVPKQLVILFFVKL